MSTENHSGMTVEAVKVKELQAQLQDIIAKDLKFKEDLYLLMWLRENKFDVNKTEENIRTVLQWREETGVDALANVPFPPQVLTYLPVKTNGRSKSGTPVYSYPAGASDFRACYEKLGHDAFLNYWRKISVQSELDLVESNRIIHSDPNKITLDSFRGLTVVIDAQNFPWRQLQNAKMITSMLGYLREIVRYYPGSVDTVIFLNVDSIFRIFLKMLVPILRSPTRSIQVYGTDQEEIKAKVFSHIHPDQLLLCSNLNP